jgi:hypothetical protein
MNSGAIAWKTVCGVIKKIRWPRFYAEWIDTYGSFARSLRDMMTVRSC